MPVRQVRIVARLLDALDSWVIGHEQAFTLSPITLSNVTLSPHHPPLISLVTISPTRCREDHWKGTTRCPGLRWGNRALRAVSLKLAL